LSAAVLTIGPKSRPHCYLAATPTKRPSQNIIDHYESPRNVGSLDKTNAFVGTGLVGAPACGDVMKLQIQVSPSRLEAVLFPALFSYFVWEIFWDGTPPKQVDENGVITESKFKTFGCGSAIASSSLATEWVKGKTLDEVLAIKNKDIAGYLKVNQICIYRFMSRTAQSISVRVLTRPCRRWVEGKCLRLCLG
jgi:nitrogen fixation NifU-like protein